MNARAMVVPVPGVASEALPWIPAATPGKWAGPLRFLGDRGFVELLRMTPGTVMPLHRHTGEVHVYQLAGQRRLGSGEVLGPGDYVYEPAGNVDWWEAVGEEDLLALAVVIGTVEFLGPGGEVCGRADVHGQRADYVRHCRAHRLPLHDLTVP